MKVNKRWIALIIASVMVVNFSMLGIIPAFAHDTMLDVEYDDCVGVVGSDGIDEMWYALNTYLTCNHLNNEVSTIKYYFEETSDSGYSWTTDISESVAEEIKNAYATSMQKWNDVYFYSYNSYGIVTKHKIINVVEGTASDHNLSIYPGIDSGTFAETDVAGTCDESELGSVIHSHYSEWKMTVYVNHFYLNNATTSNEVNLLRDRTGAHELGHVLGLRDVDRENRCSSTDVAEPHHHELLMGYGAPLVDRSANITYKDIAGVAITRGFHTDNDHKWLNCGLQSDGTYKLLCSICNGAKYVNDLGSYVYDTYNACNESHTLSSGNMMAVASYGTQDYYKCKYCRYVAPFSSIVSQNYSKTYYSDTLHECSNVVDGLEYIYYENHTFIDDECTECGVHLHTYNLCTYYNNRSHIKYCACGFNETEGHYIRQSDIVDGRYANCLGCGTLLDLFEDSADSIMSIITKVSINGSYILSNGIVVLVDDDVQAYLDGTLNFYHPDNIPNTQ